MYIIDMKEGKLNINGEEIDLDKSNCVAVEKGNGGERKIVLACGEDRNEKARKYVEEEL